MSLSFLTNVFLPARNGAYAYFAFKQHLKSVGWTVPMSSDGTTYNGSGDQITQAGSGANGMDNPSAWFVIRAPDGSHSFSFQRSYLGWGGSALQDSKYWRIKVSVVGFTGGDPVTQASAVDEGMMLGGGQDTPPNQTFDNTFIDDSHYCKSSLFHICAQTVPPYQFWAAAHGSWPDFTSGYEGLVMMEAMAPGTYPAGDTDPFVYSTWSYQATMSAYAMKGTPDELFSRVFIQAWGGQGFPNQLDVDPYNFKSDLSPTVYLPTDGGKQFGSIKGISQFTKILGVDRGTFVPVTVATLGDFISLGSPNQNFNTWLVPWNGTIPDRSV